MFDIMSALMEWYMTNPARERILIGVVVAAIALALLGLFLGRNSKTIIFGMILVILACLLGVLAVLFFIGLIFSGPITK